MRWRIRRLLAIKAYDLDVVERGVKREEQPKEIIFMGTFEEFVDEERHNTKQPNSSTCEKFAAVENHLLTFNPFVSFGLFDEIGLNKQVLFLYHKLIDLYANIHRLIFSPQIFFPR